MNNFYKKDLQNEKLNPKYFINYINNIKETDLIIQALKIGTDIGIDAKFINKYIKNKNSVLNKIKENINFQSKREGIIWVEAKK